jgi:hypothetical protein
MTIGSSRWVIKFLKIQHHVSINLINYQKIKEPAGKFSIITGVKTQLTPLVRTKKGLFLEIGPILTMVQAGSPPQKRMFKIFLSYIVNTQI